MCASLSPFSLGHEANKRAFADAGGLLLLVAILKKHIDCVEVVEKALQCASTAMTGFLCVSSHLIL